MLYNQICFALDVTMLEKEMLLNSMLNLPAWILVLSVRYDYVCGYLSYYFTLSTLCCYVVFKVDGKLVTSLSYEFDGFVFLPAITKTTLNILHRYIFSYLLNRIV